MSRWSPAITLLPQAYPIAIPLPTSGLVALEKIQCLAMLLNLWGYEEFLAHSGTEALDVAKPQRSDVAVLDIGEYSPSSRQIVFSSEQRVCLLPQLIARDGFA